MSADLAADALTALAVARASIDAAVASIQAMTPPTTPPAGNVTMLATVLGATSVRVDWSTNRSDVTSWTVGRNGKDAGGTGPWSTVVVGAGRSQTFASLLAGSSYSFTLIGHTATGDLSPITALATPRDMGTTPPPPGTDGTQVAVLNSWGPVIDGDEFEYTGQPKSTKWGMYDGAGHGGNGRRSPGAFSVANGYLTCHGDAGGTTGGMAFKGSSKVYRDEVRMQIVADDPNGTGAHYHPVLIRWPDGDDWPRGGEDDFAECNEGDKSMGAFIHHPNQSSGSSQSSASKTLDITQWHNYACERTDKTITGWIDGVQWFKFTVDETNGPPPGKLHLCLQSDNFGGTPHRPSKMNIMWVRMYVPQS